MYGPAAPANHSPKACAEMVNKLSLRAASLQRNLISNHSLLISLKDSFHSGNGFPNVKSLSVSGCDRLPCHFVLRQTRQRDLPRLKGCHLSLMECVNDWLLPDPARRGRTFIRSQHAAFGFFGVLRMKPKDSLIRLKQFQVSEKHRQVMQLETMIGEFQRMADELTKQIDAEERKAGITDVSNFAYPTFAKAARTRRDNLLGSISDLNDQKETAEASLAEAEAELQKAEKLEVREARNAEQGEHDPSQKHAMIG
jgi:flagellar export protein FliJ